MNPRPVCDSLGEVDVLLPVGSGLRQCPGHDVAVFQAS